ncbi:hypothetical protein DEJ30_08135 [Curtobacterium sp. MCPF17_003]|uniref:hypothetical protein n=1 Tax=Curtobacterium sp. MCPF17_003 TaxID=2175637 RepID=UPI000D9BAF9A|nr:hypothetical protein [Curtobacterium sp. MCPF17_003]PYY64424.1 hypothetical protein DEJ30_08135 [Curtobacterium sp. MCPF17_003]
MTTPDDPQYTPTLRHESAVAATSAEGELLLALRTLGAEGDYLVRGLATLIESMPPVLPRAVQSQHSRGLVEAGVMTAEEVAAAEDKLAQGVLQLVELSGWLASAWETVSLHAASKFLHRAPEDILGAAERGELLMVEIGGEPRFPTWQFTTRPVGHVLPHLPELLPSLLERWQPFSIGRFFATRQANLIDEGMKTPAAWLEDGGDAQNVLDIVEGGQYR